MRRYGTHYAPQADVSSQRLEAKQRVDRRDPGNGAWFALPAMVKIVIP